MSSNYTTSVQTWQFHIVCLSFLPIRSWVKINYFLSFGFLVNLLKCMKYSHFIHSPRPCSCSIARKLCLVCLGQKYTCGWDGTALTNKCHNFNMCGTLKYTRWMLRFCLKCFYLAGMTRPMFAQCYLEYHSQPCEHICHHTSNNILK